MATTLRVSTSRLASSKENLHTDIYALTTILANHRDGESQHAANDQQLAFWRNLSFLLSTTLRREEDIGANPVVAVTGNLEITPDSYTIVAAVIARNVGALPSSGKKAISEDEAPHIERILVENKLNEAQVEELLNDPEKDVELQDHVRDVFALLLLFMTMSTEKRPETTVHFVIFVLFRTYRKLVSRLLVGQKTWGANPIRIIHREWTSTTPPPESAHLNESILITQPDVRDTLGNEFKVPPGAEENTFLLNASTAGAWAQVLLNALETLEAQTGLSVDENDKYPSFPFPEAPLDDRQGLINALVVLDEFVSSKALAHLLTESVAKEIHYKKEAIQKGAIQTGKDKPHAEAQSSSRSNSTKAGIFDGFADDNNEDADDGASITSEDKGDVTFPYLNANSIPVIRYVSSLAIPLSASRSICRHLFKSLTVVAEVSVSMVTIAGTPKIHVDPNWIKSTQHRLKDTLHLDDAQVEKLRALFDKKMKRLPLVTVHAEAALMAAAVQVAEGKLDYDALQATPANEQKIRIGVSKKCCFCCAVLGDELKKLRDSSKSVRYPQFVLPGRHGIIFPWYPPPGLPVEVLRKMAERLEQALETYLIANLGTGSAQTSPTTSEHSQGGDPIVSAVAEKRFTVR